MSDAAGTTPLSQFERWRRTGGLCAGPVLAAIVVFVIVFWLTEAIPIPATALLGAALLVVCGVAPVAQVLGAFSDPIIFLFIGSFIIAQAMQVHGVDRRIAYTLLAHPWVGGSTRRTLWALGVTACTWLVPLVVR